MTVADKDRIIAQARPGRPDRLATSIIKGLELVTLDAPVARRMGLPEELRGAAVMKVEPDSPLAAYFRPLDVIYSVAGRPIQSADEVIQALASRRPPTGPGTGHPPPGRRGLPALQGPRPLMAPLVEALSLLGRAGSLTEAQSRAAVAAIMTARCPRPLIAALPGRAPGQGRVGRGAGGGRRGGPRADDRLGAARRMPAVARHLRDRRRRGQHGQHLDRLGHRGRRLRRAGGQARQPLGLGELREAPRS